MRSLCPIHPGLLFLFGVLLMISSFASGTPDQSATVAEASSNGEPVLIALNSK